MIPYKTSVAVLLVSGALMGCVSQGEKPSGLLTEVENKMTLAEANEAQDYAPLAMKQAREHVAEAKRQVDEREFSHAEKKLEVALADLEYALAKTESQKKSNAADEVTKGLQTLQREIK